MLPGNVPCTLLYFVTVFLARVLVIWPSFAFIKSCFISVSHLCCPVCVPWHLSFRVLHLRSTPLVHTYVPSCSFRLFGMAVIHACYPPICVILWHPIVFHNPRVSKMLAMPVLHTPVDHACLTHTFGRACVIHLWARPMLHTCRTWLWYIHTWAMPIIYTPVGHTCVTYTCKPCPCYTNLWAMPVLHTCVSHTYVTHLWAMAVLHTRVSHTYVTHLWAMPVLHTCEPCPGYTHLGATPVLYTPVFHACVIHTCKPHLCYTPKCMPVLHTCQPCLCYTPVSHACVTHLSAMPVLRMCEPCLCYTPVGHTTVYVQIAFDPLSVAYPLIDILSYFSHHSLRPNNIMPNSTVAGNSAQWTLYSAKYCNGLG